MIGSKRSGVFLSYSRSDGEEFAKALRSRLSESAPDIRIMRDREILEGGADWRNQIKDAIGSVEFVVLVMTPAAILMSGLQAFLRGKAGRAMRLCQCHPFRTQKNN